MPPNRKPSVCVQMPSVSAGSEAALWYVPNFFIVPTPSIVADHTQELQGDFHQGLFWSTWHVALVECAVFCLIVFRDTAQNGIHASFCEPDARIWNERIIPSPKGHLVLLPLHPITFTRKLRVQNIVQAISYSFIYTMTLLDYILQFNWQKNPGYLWYDYEAGESWPGPKHPLGCEGCKAYEANPLLATSVEVPRHNIAEYYPQAIGFDAACLYHPPLVGPAVLVPASSWAPASKLPAVEHAAVSTGPQTTPTSPTGSLAGTIAAPQVIASIPTPPSAIPAAATDAYETLPGTCRLVGVAQPKGVVGF